MRKIQSTIICVIVTMLASGCASTAKIRPISSVKELTEQQVVSSMAEKPRFYTHKRLTYVMAWNGIPVGRIMAESGDIIDYEGYKVYTLKLVTESNKFLSKIYRVEDTYTSYIDTTTMTSRFYEADRKEGNYRKHLVVKYDFQKNEAIYTNLTDGSVKTCSIKKIVQDPLSSICYFMTLPLKPGEEVNFYVNLNEKNYDLSGKVETIDVIKIPRLGNFPAFKIRPYVTLEGAEVKKGRAWLYFAAEGNRYPLFGVVRIPFGRVTATLVSIEDI